MHNDAAAYKSVQEHTKANAKANAKGCVGRAFIELNWVPSQAVACEKTVNPDHPVFLFETPVVLLKESGVISGLSGLSWSVLRYQKRINGFVI